MSKRSKTDTPTNSPTSSAAEEAPKSRAKAKANKSETGETHQRFVTTSVTDPEKIRTFAIEAARMLADDKCEDVVLLDVTGLSQLSDFIIIGSGTSDRQMQSSGDDIEKLGEKLKYTIYRRHSDDRNTWIVLDFVDVVAHLFEPNTRAHYDLEMLWSDAKRVQWERPDQLNRNRAGLE